VGPVRRAHDAPTTSGELSETIAEPLDADDPELVQALQTHKLTWST